MILIPGSITTAAYLGQITPKYSGRPATVTVKVAPIKAVARCFERKYLAVGRPGSIPVK